MLKSPFEHSEQKVDACCGLALHTIVRHADVRLCSILSSIRSKDLFAEFLLACLSSMKWGKGGDQGLQDYPSCPILTDILAGGNEAMVCLLVSILT